MPGPARAGGAPAPRGRATLRDVAARAGVSPQTVSNVVNGTGRLSEPTRRRVLAAIDHLGYRSHGAAASLRSGRADRIAYPLPVGEPAEDNTVLLEFLQHLVVAADRRRQQLLVIRPERDAVRAIEEVVRSGTIDSVVLTALVEDDPRVRRLHRTKVPFACFGRTDPGRPQSWVDIDNRAGVRSVTELLLGNGHRRIAFLGYATDRRWDAEREAGYRDAMGSARLRPRVVHVGPAGPQRPLGNLLRGDTRPTAIVAGSDVLAAACYAGARARGLRIGDDLAVTGFDGTAVARLLTPSLTTVAMPLPAIAERIVARLLGEVTTDEGEVLDTELVIGESSGPVSS